MNLCIYRTPNSCICCPSLSKMLNYCNIHKNNENRLYDIIYKAIGRSEINNNEIYKLFKYIYNNDSIYTKEYVFKGCLKILYTDNNYEEKFKLNLNTYNFEKRYYRQYEIIYRFFMNNLIKKYKYNTELKLNNTEDPFTLDNIDDIKNKDNIFIFQDGENNYFFIATELKYFIETNGPWNPYTKKEFGDIFVKHLNYFICKYKLQNKKTNNEWNSVQQAFTDVSQIIEKVGFYNDPRWLLKLTSRQIKGIIKTFKLVARDNQANNQYFNNITDNNIFYDFAREIILLFQNGNDNFMLCCNFIKSIALYSDDFYNNIPEWMSDIEMPLQPTIITIPINNIVFNSAEILYLLMNNE